MKRAARGFTLVELMMVVAIIGILAAIAVPQYQIYTGRAQLAEAIQVASKLEPTITELIQSDVPLASINGGALGVPADVSISAGRYVESVVVAGGAIVATMKGAAVSPCVTGKSVVLTPSMASANSPVKWTCTSDAICPPITCD